MRVCGACEGDRNCAAGLPSLADSRAVIGLRTCVAELCPQDPEAAEPLADAIEATAHGYAALLTDQPGPPDPTAVNHAPKQAAISTLALIRGRAAL